MLLKQIKRHVVDRSDLTNHGTMVGRFYRTYRLHSTENKEETNHFLIFVTKAVYSNKKTRSSILEVATRKCNLLHKRHQT